MKLIFGFYKLKKAQMNMGSTRPFITFKNVGKVKLFYSIFVEQASLTHQAPPQKPQHKTAKKCSFAFFF